MDKVLLGAMAGIASAGMVVALVMGTINLAAINQQKQTAHHHYFLHEHPVSLCEQLGQPVEDGGCWVGLLKAPTTCTGGDDEAIRCTAKVESGLGCPDGTVIKYYEHIEDFACWIEEGRTGRE